MLFEDKKLSLRLSLEYPRGEGNWAARQGQKLSRGNFYPAATRCLTGPSGRLRTECTKIAHRRALAIFTADEGIARNSAARTTFTHFLRRRNRGSLVIFFAEEIAHLGASKNRAILWGAVKIAAAAAENRAILVHSGWERTISGGDRTSHDLSVGPI